MAYILKEDRPQILEAVRNRGFKPEDFERTEAELTYRLTHKATGHWFEIVSTPGNHKTFLYVSTTFPYLNQAKSGVPLLLEKVVSAMDGWLRKQVSRQIKENELPDPWDEIEKQFDNTTAAVAYREGNFTAKELEQVQQRFEALEKQVQAISKDAEEKPVAEYAVKELREIVEDAKKEKRKKTIRQIAGLLIEVGKALVKDTEGRKALLHELQGLWSDIISWGRHLLNP